MILLLAVAAGLLAGIAHARWQKRAWEMPPLKSTWLVLLFFLPQFLAFYWPATRARMSDPLAAASLIISQALLLVFTWINRRLAGMWLLSVGLALNLTVIVANGGFMPISPQTAAHLVPEEIVQSIVMGDRFGKGKDILLLPEDTNFVWLSDRILLPKFSSYQAAISFGDILIATGAFWLLAAQKAPYKL